MPKSAVPSQALWGVYGSARSGVSLHPGDAKVSELLDQTVNVIAGQWKLDGYDLSVGQLSGLRDYLDGFVLTCCCPELRLPGFPIGTDGGAFDLVKRIKSIKRAKRKLRRTPYVRR